MPGRTERRERRKTTRVNWGDGHEVKVRHPRLREIPGPSVVCPPECNPVGETDQEWLENEAPDTR